MRAKRGFFEKICGLSARRVIDRRAVSIYWNLMREAGCLWAW